MAKSIIQHDKKICYLCGQNACGDPLDKHHIFGGALRNKSERYGLTVYLHHNKCHIFGKHSVHQNSQVANQLKRLAQERAMFDYHWTVEDFRKRFYKSYL